MNGWDWIMSGFNLVIGLFLGIVLYGFVELIQAGLWPFVVLLILAFGAVLLFDRVFTNFIEWVFGARVTTSKARRGEPPRPKLRRLSLPFGLLAGFGLGVTGLGLPLLEALP